MTTTTETQVTQITHTFAADALFTGEEGECDAQASIERYAEMVAEALNDSYPEAQVSVNYITDADSVNRPWFVIDSDGTTYDASDDLVIYEIEPVIEPVFAEGEWVVA